MIAALIQRDLRLSFRKGSGMLATLAFFMIAIALFPFALGGAVEALRPVAAGAVWIAALLAAFLSLDGIWHDDYADGTFDALLTADVPPFVIVFAKTVSHWLVAGLPLVLAGLPAALMLHAPVSVLLLLAASMVIGTLYTSLAGGLGAVLTFGARRTGLLIALLVLPLCVPMLVLGVLGAAAVLADLPVRAYLLLQLALLIAMLPLGLVAMGTILRMQTRLT
ncbi:MAG: heme exporter protein CcmB [Alphaproteobacteria bacterium]|nr:heme exporter protein CcmB [Alphaproteobacteria bacterium]